MSASWLVDSDGVAVVTLLNPPMNALAPQRACPAAAGGCAKPATVRVASPRPAVLAR
jgi:hypothetical protein